MWHVHDGMGLWMVFWMVVFWGAIVALVVWGIKKLTERGSLALGAPETCVPLDIAKERYARGEISREELDQIKNDIS